ncbi:MAG: dTDP-glucose 4,6-dehydratase, partial [Desulfobulbales bacterium]
RANLEALINNPKFLFIHGDIRDYDLVLNLLQDQQIDTIVHFAAESHVDRSIHGPDTFVDTNITGTHTLLKAAKAIWLDSSSINNSESSRYRFHHISTDEVYGSLGLDDSGFSEITPYAPNSPYAASKAGSDFLVRSYYKTYGLPMTISNCSNNYGPYQHPEKLIPLLILNCLNGKPLPIYGDGLNIRDWLYVEDHCRGIDLILKKGRLGETYNIGGNCERTNLQVVETVCSLMDELHPDKLFTPHSSLLTYVKDRLGHDRRYAIDANKIMSELSYKPVESFETGMRKTVLWYLENLKWCREVMGEDYQKWLQMNYS